jgi:uncharacterized membrane protein YeaQ/YmgE (transglycosylase-associated protein family)
MLVPTTGFGRAQPVKIIECWRAASMFSLLWTAIIGLIVGALAKLVMPGKDPGGILVTMIIGIAGSFLGTFLGRMIGHYQEGQSAGFIMSFIGAVILLAIYHFFKRRQVV